MIPSPAKIVGTLLLCLAMPALGKVSLKVSPGWEGAYRVGRWTPVFITLSDDTAQPARNVVLDFVAPHDNSFAMRVTQRLAIGQEPRTVVVYLPLTWQLDETVAVVRDAGGWRKLAERSLDPSGGSLSQNYTYAASGRNEILLGVSGQRTQLGLLGNFPWSEASGKRNSDTNAPGRIQQLKAGFLDAAYLPDARVGYDSLDVLLLNAVDLVELQPQQEQAIADWVRAGGNLLIWPGTRLLPESSPIVQLLPGAVGESTNIDISLDDARQLGLVSRIAKIAGRQITPHASARKLSVLRDKAMVCLGRAGLGTVGLLSFDPSQLVFERMNEPEQQNRPAVRFWRPVFKALVTPDETENSANYWNLRPEEGRRLVAMEAVVNRLGDVPGVGTFDFSYIAIVMAAMMLIVGPIDWFVLKKLGKQPWTWITTSGWIALVTFGALYVGYLFRSGDLHYRSVRLIDQADGQVVAALDVAGIYSPRTQWYLLDGPRTLWWEPANIDAAYPWRRTQKTPSDILMDQDRQGNRPEPMIINVWSLRFMTAESGDAQALPAPLEVSLARGRNAAGQDEIRGAIRNNSASTIRSLYIRTRDGGAPAPAGFSIKPGQTLEIHWPIRNEKSLVPPPVNYSPYGGGENAYGNTAWSFARATCDLAGDRTDRIEKLLAGDTSLACIYAESDEVPATVNLRHKNAKPAIEKHYEVIRALVELK